MKEKIAELKKYELVLDAEIYTWDYIIDDVHRVGDIVRNQSEAQRSVRCMCMHY